MRRTPTRLTAAALALALAAALAGCGGTAEQGAAPDGDDVLLPDEPADDGARPDTPDADTPDADEPGVDDPATEEPDADAPQAEDPAAPVDGTVTPSVEVDGRTLTITWQGGTHTATFDPSQADELGGVLVHPGWTASDVDVVVAAIRGEVTRLYHLPIRDDVAGEATIFPDAYQPQSEVEASVTFGWTPDGRSLVWTEPTAAGLTLRTIGWQDGPGTGRTADDNAAFVLDTAPDAQLDGFVVHDDTHWTLELIDGMGGRHSVEMERQADGALALLPAR